MAQHMDSLRIYRRKDGRWEGRYPSGWDENGKTKYSSVYGKTREEAEKKLMQFCPVSDTEDIWNITLREAMNLSMKMVKVNGKPTTVQYYEFLIEKHILPQLGSIRVRELTSAEVNDFLRKKMESGRLDGKGGLSTNYVRSMAKLLIMTEHYIAGELQLVSPFTAVDIPENRKKETTVFTREESVKLDRLLFDQLDGTKLGILLAEWAGLRLGEVCALRWKDVDIDRAVLLVRHSLILVKNVEGSRKKTRYVLGEVKTNGSYRIVPIIPKLLGALKELKNEEADTFVTTGTRRQLSPRTMQNRFHAILRRANVTKHNFHALRHSFATRCIEANTDIKSLSVVLGHASTAFTLDTYVHLSLDILQREIGKIG